MSATVLGVLLRVGTLLTSRLAARWRSGVRPNGVSPHPPNDSHHPTHTHMPGCCVLRSRPGGVRRRGDALEISVALYREGGKVCYGGIHANANERDWTEQERADHLPTGVTPVQRETFARNVEQQSSRWGGVLHRCQGRPRRGTRAASKRRQGIVSKPA